MKYVELELHSISINIWNFVKDNYERRILSNYEEYKGIKEYMRIWYILLV
jgi:hypothetical protein